MFSERGDLQIAYVEFRMKMRSWNLLLLLSLPVGLLAQPEYALRDVMIQAEQDKREVKYLFWCQVGFVRSAAPTTRFVGIRVIQDVPDSVPIPIQGVLFPRKDGKPDTTRRQLFALQRMPINNKGERLLYFELPGTATDSVYVGFQAPGCTSEKQHELTEAKKPQSKKSQLKKAKSKSPRVKWDPGKGFRIAYVNHSDELWFLGLANKVPYVGHAYGTKFGAHILVE